jgi:Bacterial regulatory proteins, luxR family
VLSERLGLSLSRQMLRRIVESTLGNPLFALEVGRTFIESGLRQIGEDIPVPDAVEDMLGKEIAQAFYVAVNTVEVHLSHVYAKLGVRSRTQLAQRLAGPG